MPFALLFLLAAGTPLRTERLAIPAEVAIYLNLTKAAASEFIRVVGGSSGTGHVRLGEQVVPPSSGTDRPEWDLSGVFRFGVPNEIRAEGTAAPFWLVHGPRVFIESQRATRDGIEIVIRNALENTANVDIELQLCTPGSRRAEWSAEKSVTVPPGSSMALSFPTTVGAGTWRLNTLATKHTEAMEDEYQVEEVSEVTVPAAESTGAAGLKRN
ncbi:MAG: hypothetical protein ABI693_15885 [Bryobacteraceae bacterium]